MMCCSHWDREYMFAWGWGVLSLGIIGLHLPDTVAVHIWNMFWDPSILFPIWFVV